jgi:hypothetical protein
MLTLTELGEPGIRIFPCIFPAEQGFDRRDGFALDSFHLWVLIIRPEGIGSIFDVDESH